MTDLKTVVLDVGGSTKALDGARGQGEASGAPGTHPGGSAGHRIRSHGSCDPWYS
jgi:hypothetical protein